MPFCTAKKNIIIDSVTFETKHCGPRSWSKTYHNDTSFHVLDDDDLWLCLLKRACQNLLQCDKFQLDWNGLYVKLRTTWVFSEINSSTIEREIWVFKSSYPVRYIKPNVKIQCKHIIEVDFKHQIEMEHSSSAEKREYLPERMVVLYEKFTYKISTEYGPSFTRSNQKSRSTI